MSPSLAPAATVSTRIVRVARTSAERQWQLDEANVIRRIGFWIMLAFFFVRFSLVSEILTFGFGFRPFLVVVLGPLAVLAVAFSGGLTRSIRERPGRFWIGFMIWLLVAAPFSVWRGGTFLALRSAFLTEFSMFFMVTGLAVTLAELRLVCWAIALSGLVDAAAVRFFGQTTDGRLAIAFGTLSNPNDLATHLLVILPFLLLTMHGAAAVSAWRIAGLGAVLASLHTIFLTGSRMALLALAGIGVFILLRSTPLQKVGLIAVLSIGAVMASLALPEVTVQRYKTTLGSESAEVVDYDAYLQSVGSRRARVELLGSSVALTLKNPLFGVGPGQFSVSDAEAAAREGRRAAWQVTHNTYTEISSEAGIPALIFFSGSLLACFGSLSNVYRNALGRSGTPKLAYSAFYLMLSLFGFSVCILFTSMTYRFYAAALIGIVCVYLRAARRELEATAGVSKTSAAPMRRLGGRVP